MKIVIKIVAIFIIFIMIGCAGNKPQSELDSDTETFDNDDADNLFGISENEKSGVTNDDEAEVLKLLGITKDENVSNQVEEQPTSYNENEGKYQAEIADLEQQLLNKDAEISNLKSDIAQKDLKINTLEVETVSKDESGTQVSMLGDFEQDYQNAFSTYQNKNYKQAITIFENLLARGENSLYMDNCQYWIGECYYGLGKFNQAIVEFTKVFSYSKANKNDDAQLKLGICYLKLGDKQKAKEEFERLLSDYPKSEYVQKVEYYLSQL